MKSKEPICLGDVVQYYNPISVAGDPQGLRETTVLSVGHASKYFPLVLCNGKGLPSTDKVKRIKVFQHNDNELVDHPGIFRSIDQFKLKKRGSATAADAIYMQVNCLEGITKKHITNGMENAKMDGCGLGDLMLHDICSGDNENSATILDTIKTKNMNSREYEFPHNLMAKAIEILKCYGTVHDVLGDGSCGCHCTMLLLRRMKVIDNTLHVSLFWRVIHDFPGTCWSCPSTNRLLVECSGSRIIADVPPLIDICWRQDEHFIALLLILLTASLRT